LSVYDILDRKWTGGGAMERIKRITIITFLVLFLSAVVIFALLFIESGKTEDIYKNAANAIEDKEWETAYNLIKQVPHYKSAGEIEMYLYPVMTYYKEYSTNEEKLNGMSIADSYIDANIGSIQDEGYKKQLTDLKETIAFQREKMSVLAVYDQETKLLDGSIELIRGGKLEEAEQQLASINSIRYSQDKKQLMTYVDLLQAAALGDETALETAAALLDPAYTGSLNQEIKASIAQYLDENKWYKLYQEAAARAAEEEQNKAPENASTPQKLNTIAAIGDSRSAVIKTMGNPVSSQSINNSFGQCEKMVYSGDIIIYIENEQVTAVKG
jgi:hypothetical protein